jgi:hypothetical protein
MKRFLIPRQSANFYVDNLEYCDSVEGGESIVKNLVAFVKQPRVPQRIAGWMEKA